MNKIRKKLLIDGRNIVDIATNKKNPANGILYNNAIDLFEEINEAINNNVINTNSTNKVLKTGDTMTGLLVLPQIKIGSNDLPINNVVSTIVDDNTKLPTSKAVYDFVGNLSYTNALPVPEDVGGIETGDTFDNVSIMEMFNKILYPYQYPAFLSFEIQAYQLSRYEVGTLISGDQTFIWATSNGSNITANSIQISGDNITTLSNTANDGTQIVAFDTPLTRTTAGTKSWSIQGSNSKNQTFSRSNTVRWDFMMYYGSSTNTSLTEAQIKVLQSSNLTVGNTGTLGNFTFPVNGYKYFVFADDASYSKPSNFVDTATGFAVGMYQGFGNTQNGYSYDLVSITNTLGITKNYRVYRTQNILASSITIQIS